jgi:hypothetical protein
MNSKELEEKIYEFGHVMYRLGRMETDDQASTKEYNKFCKEKESLMEFFNVQFKGQSKVAKSLNIV